MTSSFLDLPLGNLEHLVDDTIVDISLNPHFYEAKMAQELGFLPFDLSIINKNDNQVLTFCKNIIFSDLEVEVMERKVFNKITKEYANLSYACSMKIEDINQLMQVATFAYQVSYANYLFMARKGSVFPYRCCGMASERVNTALILHGFVNSVYMYDKMGDHAYVGLPFVMQQTNEKGIIIVDPTSDQLWDGKNPRNMVRIVSSTKWEYVTKYNQGKDLYPSIVESIGGIKDRGKGIYSYRTIGHFMREVFEKQVLIEICGIQN